MIQSLRNSTTLDSDQVSLMDDKKLSKFWSGGRNIETTSSLRCFRFISKGVPSITSSGRWKLRRYLQGILLLTNTCNRLFC